MALKATVFKADIQVAEDLFIAPTRPEDRHGAMLYTNHSCDPNIAIAGQIVFVAMREIAPGEELPHDWAIEGDFSEEEVEIAINNGFEPINLGKTRLRTETACLVAANTIHFINNQ